MSAQSLTDIIQGHTKNDPILQLLVAELSNIRESLDEVKAQTSKQDSALVDIKTQLDSISKVNLSLQRHETALFGANGDNGLTGDMKEVKKDLNKLGTFRTQALMIAAGCSFLIVAVKDWFINGGHK